MGRQVLAGEGREPRGWGEGGTDPEEPAVQSGLGPVESWRADLEGRQDTARGQRSHGLRDRTAAAGNAAPRGAACTARGPEATAEGHWERQAVGSQEHERNLRSSSHPQSSWR